MSNQINQTNLDIIRLEDVKRRTGLSRSTIYEWIKQSKFPEAISLGDRSVGWLSSDIDAWIIQRVKSTRENNQF